MQMTIEQVFAYKLSKIFSTAPHGYQKEIAYMAGMSATRLNNIVKGRRGSDEDTRRAICDALGIPDYERFVLREDVESTPSPELLEIYALLRDHASPALLRSLKQKLLELRDAGSAL